MVLWLAFSKSLTINPGLPVALYPNTLNKILQHCFVFSNNSYFLVSSISTSSFTYSCFTLFLYPSSPTSMFFFQSCYFPARLLPRLPSASVLANRTTLFAPIVAYFFLYYACVSLLCSHSLFDLLFRKLTYLSSMFHQLVLPINKYYNIIPSPFHTIRRFQRNLLKKSPLSLPIHQFFSGFIRPVLILLF